MQVLAVVSHICANTEVISNSRRVATQDKILPKRGLLALCREPVDHAFPKFEALRVSAQLNDFGNLITRITVRLHD